MRAAAAAGVAVLRSRVPARPRFPLPLLHRRPPSRVLFFPLPRARHRRPIPSPRTSASSPSRCSRSRTPWPPAPPSATARAARRWPNARCCAAAACSTLAIPAAHGGQQAAWPLIFRILRRLAQADSSLAHLFGFQHLQVASVLLFGSEAQQARFLGEAVEKRWFWGNAVNARDTRLQAVRTDDGIEIDGVKGFCSGAPDSDVLNVSVVLGPEPTDRLFAVVPTSRAGITVLGDWDNMGQRQTDSGNVEFRRVRIAHDEILGPPGVASSPRATLRNLIGQIVLTEIYLGNAFGALRAAIEHLRAHTQPWPMAGVERAEDDRLLQLRAGEMWSALQAATALSNQANERFQQAWEQGFALTADSRGALAIDVAAARTQAARTALHVTSQIFELVGARGTASKHNLDRYWRNVRVHTLHDPLDYRHQGIGAWLLAGDVPNPYGYG
ncbi:acyl-CoA dehydrogenase family protein [Variovorax sp. UC122_21]|uniref:acyl-CoA dehydrogenase family protein n=1 Tax=Variovorax sp. UC122_21 TaxID=3374554 RepID=UPI003756F22D